MKNRVLKIFMCLTIVLLLIPAFSAQAATNITATSITNNSLMLNWTLGSGETSANIYKDDSYQANVAGTSYYVSGLSKCTTYVFEVIGNGSFSGETISVKTTGCPTAPVITYNSKYNSTSLSWTSSNAVSYDIYKDGNYVTTTIYNNYTVTNLPSTALWIKIVARNSTGQTAETTVVISTPAVNDSWTFSSLYGDIKMKATFTNPREYSTSIYISLFRLTGTGEVNVSTQTVFVGGNQTVTAVYPLATSQPFGTYRVSVNSPYILPSNVLLGSSF
ncbi:hypothetical protein [Cohnella abietis]|uniref:Fibronectin type-III domain-containing protein n=1 Tax=Cohnella abietis TaxID=2507935 RepID=A0A3T1D663_9BACL|nr:hypothetical protein [Cohnella abietis]BBI33561.1 hypothetical protein KCTCHS21_29600 [Cohnella abietis]